MQRTYQFTELGPSRAEGEIFSLLSAAGVRKKVKRGALIMHQGDVGKGFWVIETGNVMACRFGANGERIVYAVLGPGDLIGELACFGSAAQQVNAIAEGDAELIWLDMAQIDHLLATEPLFVRWLLNSMAAKLRAALNRIEGDHSLSAEARIAKILSDISASQGATIKLTQQELADLVGVSRLTAGQILNRMAAEGAITLGYGKITLLDADICARFA